MADDDRSQLDIDESGNIITHPVLGWTTGVLAETYVLLGIEYAEEGKQKSKQVQLILTPAQSLALAEKMTTLANRVLSPSEPPN